MKTALGRARLPLSFRAHLQSEFARRCATNPQYSLRAFARDLDVHHATLSQVLRGERPLTPGAIAALCAALRVPDALVQAYLANEPLAASASRETAARLTRSAAEVIGEWHHFALLELTHLESFRPDVRWIAQVLNITTDEVTEALTRLLRLRLIEMRGDSWVDVAGDAIAHADDFTQAAIERLFDQVRRLTAASIAQPRRRHRSHGVTTLAADSRRLPEAIAAIERFRTELAALLSTETPDVLVQFETHLFPLTHIDKESE
jgi:uncharacterized protein (TIGR02147 family)